jgi:hypothetical protein
MMKRATLVAFIGALLLCSGVAAAPRGGGDFEVTKFTLDGGGGTSSDGPYVLSGLIGQPDAGQMTGGSFALSGGFFSGQANSPPCPGDTTGDGTVNVEDLVAVITAWGPAAPGAPEDTNGDGSVNVTDLVSVITLWGPCP